MAQSLGEELHDFQMNEPLGTNAADFNISTLFVSVSRHLLCTWGNFCLLFLPSCSLFNPLPRLSSRAGCCPVGWMTARSRTSTRSAWRSFLTVLTAMAWALCAGRSSRHSASRCSWTAPRQASSRRCCGTMTAIQPGQAPYLSSLLFPSCLMLCSLPCWEKMQLHAKCVWSGLSIHLYKKECLNPPRMQTTVGGRALQIWYPILISDVGPLSPKNNNISKYWIIY